MGLIFSKGNFQGEDFFWGKEGGGISKEGKFSGGNLSRREGEFYGVNFLGCLPFFS